MVPFIASLTNKVLGQHSPSFPAPSSRNQQPIEQGSLASLSVQELRRSEQNAVLKKKDNTSEASLGRWENPLEPELMKHPFWRGKGVKAIKITKSIVGTPSFFKVIERSGRKPQLRSPERGLTLLITPTVKVPRPSSACCSLLTPFSQSTAFLTRNHTPKVFFTHAISMPVG